MSTIFLCARVLAAFIFNNGGPSEVLPLLMAALSVWVVVALGYVLLKPEPYPLFFGVPAVRASWHAKPFPRKWLVFFAIVAGYFLFKLLYP